MSAIDRVQPARWGGDCPPAAAVRRVQRRPLAKKRPNGGPMRDSASLLERMRAVTGAHLRHPVSGWVYALVCLHVGGALCPSAYPGGSEFSWGGFPLLRLVCVALVLALCARPSAAPGLVVLLLLGTWLWPAGPALQLAWLTGAALGVAAPLWLLTTPCSVRTAFGRRHLQALLPLAPPGHCVALLAARTVVMGLWLACSWATLQAIRVMVTTHGLSLPPMPEEAARAARSAWGWTELSVVWRLWQLGCEGRLRPASRCRRDAAAVPPRPSPAGAVRGLLGLLALPEVSPRRWLVATLAAWALYAATLAGCGALGHAAPTVLSVSLSILVLSAGDAAAALWPRGGLVDGRQSRRAYRHVELLLPRPYRSLWAGRYAVVTAYLALAALTPLLIARLLQGARSVPAGVAEVTDSQPVVLAAAGALWVLWPLVPLLAAYSRWSWVYVFPLAGGTLIGAVVGLAAGAGGWAVSVPAAAVVCGLVACSWWLCEPNAWPIGDGDRLHHPPRALAAALSLAVGLPPGLIVTWALSRGGFGVW